MQEYIDKLKAQEEGASHEIGDIEYTSDTTATVTCKVFNFLRIDTLGQSGDITQRAEYKINFVKRDGKWLVKMESPLQNERQNRD